MQKKHGAKADIFLSGLEAAQPRSTCLDEPGPAVNGLSQDWPVGGIQGLLTLCR